MLSYVAWAGRPRQVPPLSPPWSENRFSNLLQPGRYSLVVEYSSSAFPWLFAGQTMNDERESAKKLQVLEQRGDVHGGEVVIGETSRFHSLTRIG